MSSRRARLSLIAFFLALGCDGSTTAPESFGEPACHALRVDEFPESPGIVLVINDTMRRDRSEIYGGTVSTPHLEDFATEAIIFDQAFTQSTWTKPAIATLFTSLYPSQHRVASDPQIRDPSNRDRRNVIQADRLSEGFVTLAEVLEEGGYRTGAFISNPWLEARFGFDQGFAHYEDMFSHWDGSGHQVSRSALEWLNQIEPGSRFFLYVHYVDSHAPYGRLSVSEVRAASTPEKPVFGENTQARRLVAESLKTTDGRSVMEVGARPTLELIETAYDRGVRDFDGAFGILLEGLRSHPAWDRTAVIVTSDHGEALYDRGYGNHGTGLFDDEAAIPFLARFPGAITSSDRSDCLVGLIDVLPSICDYVDARCPDSVAGRSFIQSPTSGRSGERRLLVTEGIRARPNHRSVRDREFKLMYEPGGRPSGRVSETPYSLYRMSVDSGETTDELAAAPVEPGTHRVFEALKRQLHASVEPFAPPEPSHAPVDPKLEQRLRSLGYLEEEAPREP